MGWIGCIRREKLRRDLVARTFALIRNVFAPSFVRQPNGPKCTQMVRNTPKHVFRIQWGGSGALITKNSDASSWHELIHYFEMFCPEFRKSTEWSQMHPNGTKCTKTCV